MSEVEIKAVFEIEIQKRGIANHLEGITRNTINNWRHHITTPSISDRIGVLYLLGKIKITRNLDGKPNSTT